MTAEAAGQAPTSCSIVIRANNEEQHIARLLQGICEQCLPDIEVILVDSGSTDRTVAIAEAFFDNFNPPSETPPRSNDFDPSPDTLPRSNDFDPPPDTLPRSNDFDPPPDTLPRSNDFDPPPDTLPRSNDFDPSPETLPRSNDFSRYQRSLKLVHIRPENFTFGYALNQGLAHATRELVVIASAHVYPVYADWLEHLLRPFADPQIALAYGKQRGDLTSRFAEGQIFHHWYPDRSQARQPYPFCNNANAAIRRSLWEGHRYDETLPGLEDLEWGHRMMGLGYAISYVAEAEIVHVHNETPRRVYNRYRREAMAFKRIFPQEHFRWWDVLRHFSANALSDLAHAIRQSQLTAHFADILWFRWMQFWGTYQGYRRSGPLTWQLRQTFYYPRGMGAAGGTPARDIAPIQYHDQTKE